MSNTEVQKAIAWTDVVRRNKKSAVKFNTFNKVSATTIIEWNTGKPIQTRIFQTSMAREDFSY